MAILIAGPRWVGDMVMAHVLVRALRELYPETPIDMAAPGGALAIASRMAEIRECIPLPYGSGRLSLAARYRFARSLAGQYDRAFVLQGSWKSALVPFLAGIPHRTGYRGEYRYGLVNEMVSMPPGERRKTARMFFGLAHGGAFRPPSLAVDLENRARLQARHGLERKEYACLMPGAEFGPAKRWPASSYAAVANDLVDRGYAVVVLGAPNDAPVAEAIASAAPGITDLTGRTRLEDAVDILSGASVAITNDSGLMHVAAAVGTPVTAIYGPTSSDDTPPLAAHAELVSLRLTCSPCHKRICPLQHNDCMGKLEPSLVTAATDRLIRASAGPSRGA